MEYAKQQPILMVPKPPTRTLQQRLRITTSCPSDCVMQLSQASRTHLLQKYDPFILRRANLFYNQAPKLNRDRFEDLLQEARCAFCQTIDRAEDERDLIRRAPCRMFAAMWEYCREMAPVYIPHNQYQKQIPVYDCVSADEQELDSVDPNDLINDICFDLTLNSALHKMPLPERVAIRMCYEGYSNKEMMQQLHIYSDSAMSRLLKRARNHLADLLELPCNPKRMKYHAV